MIICDHCQKFIELVVESACEQNKNMVKTQCYDQSFYSHDIKNLVSKPAFCKGH